MADTPSPHSVMEKFEFYFLGLTFTLLALAVQSFKPSPSLSADVIEILGWLFLLVSGLLGLSKVEWISAMLYTQARLSYFEQARDDLQKAQAQNLPLRDSKDGRTLNPAEMIEKNECTLSDIKSQGNKMDKKHEFKHKGQKAFFLIGLIALLVARAHNVVQRILGSLC